MTGTHFPGQAPWASAAQLRADGFGADPLFEALIAELDGEAVGMVSFYRGYAGMRGQAMGMVHTLYVEPPARRLGAARALMAAVAATALKRGWCRLELFVEEGLPALVFYRALGLSISLTVIVVLRAPPARGVDRGPKKPARSADILFFGWLAMGSRRVV